jgi:hypothetical protein
MISKSLLLFIFFTSVILGQEYETGLLLDDSLYKDRPIAATLMRGNYDDLPSAVSLKQYAPAPGNQGPRHLAGPQLILSYTCTQRIWGQENRQQRIFLHLL